MISTKGLFFTKKKIDCIISFLCNWNVGQECFMAYQKWQNCCYLYGDLFKSNSIDRSIDFAAYKKSSKFELVVQLQLCLDLINNGTTEFFQNRFKSTATTTQLRSFLKSSPHFCCLKVGLKGYWERWRLLEKFPEMWVHFFLVNKRIKVFNHFASHRVAQ